MHPQAPEDVPGVFAGVHHDGQPVKRRVGVATAQAFDVRADDVVVCIAFLVVQHGTLLDRLFGCGAVDDADAVRVRFGREGGELKGVAVRPMGEAYITSSPYTLSNRIGDMGTYESSYMPQRATDPASDTYAYQNGYATLTPLKFDWTAHEMIEAVQSWGITLGN